VKQYYRFIMGAVEKFPNFTFVSSLSSWA
jgi:hypothetical protein